MLGNSVKEKGTLVEYYRFNNLLIPSSALKGIQKYEPKDQTGEHVFYNVFIEVPSFVAKNEDGFPEYDIKLIRSKLFSVQFNDPDRAADLDYIFDTTFTSAILNSVVVNLNTLAQAVLQAACKKGLIAVMDY